jgi:hypothetical protein
MRWLRCLRVPCFFLCDLCSKAFEFFGGIGIFGHGFNPKARGDEND